MYICNNYNNDFLTLIVVNTAIECFSLAGSELNGFDITLHVQFNHYIPSGCPHRTRSLTHTLNPLPRRTRARKVNQLNRSNEMGPLFALHLYCPAWRPFGGGQVSVRSNAIVDDHHHHRQSANRGSGGGHEMRPLPDGRPLCAAHPVSGRRSDAAAGSTTAV